MELYAAIGILALYSAGLTLAIFKIHHTLNEQKKFNEIYEGQILLQLEHIRILQDKLQVLENIKTNPK